MSIDVEKLRELEQAATPGPWEVDLLGQYIHNAETQMMIAEMRGWGHLIGILGLDDDQATKAQRDNATLIVTTRNSLPALLDEHEALCDTVAAMDKEIERLNAAQYWVPVAEKRPTQNDANDDGNVLAVVERDTCVTWAHWSAAIFRTEFKGRKATHWMPLPDLPKEDA